ncbi:MAG: hypothetical protein WCV62_03785 [Candidatus Peribacteraceae bacterium]|jgi:hypothetical protein
MRRSTAAATGLLTLTLLLTACQSPFQSSVFPEGDGASSSEEVLELMPAEEVTYQGTVQALPAGSSLEEATHRLALGEGLYLYLRSDTVDLDEYVDQEVRAKGVVRSTVEGDADMMRVSYMETILSDASSSSSESESSSSQESSSQVSSEPIPASSSVRSVVSSSAASVAVQQSSASSASSLSDQEKTMAKAGTDAGLWTQKYCSTHIGFCIPVYKNWWYKSFGATDASLWHVELSTQEIENMGEGVIALDFESGPLPSGGTDGAVQDADGGVVGYRAWTNGRHFRITAPSSLRSSVRYITENLTTYEVPTE